MTVFYSCACSVFLLSYRNTIFNRSAHIFLGLFCKRTFCMKASILPTPRRVIGNSKRKEGGGGGGENF